MEGHEPAVGEGNALAVALPEAGDVAVVVVGVLFVVRGRGEIGRRRVRVAGLDLAVVAVVLPGGQIAPGIRQGGRQTVQGVGGGGVGLGQCRAHCPLPTARLTLCTLPSGL